MQFWFANKKKGQIFSLVMIISLPVSVTLILYLFFPDDDRFEEIFNDQRADAVSIAYLEQLLRSSPNNWRLRYKLGSQLKATGQYVEAWDTVNSFNMTSLKSDRYLKTCLLKAEIASFLAFSATDVESNEYWKTIATTLLKNNDWEHSTKAELKRLIVLAPALELQDMTGDFYYLLSTIDPQNSIHWLGSAAEWKLAAGKGYQAGIYYRMIAPKLSGNEGWENAADAFSAIPANSIPTGTFSVN